MTAKLSLGSSAWSEPPAVDLVRTSEIAMMSVSAGAATGLSRVRMEGN